jgi:hypothetical protein
VASQSKDSPIRYVIATRKKAARRWSLADMAGYVAAPLFGSRLIFPRLLAQTLTASGRSHPGPVLPVAWALRYFRQRLVIWISPSLLTHKLAEDVHTGEQALWLGASFLDGADWSGALMPLADLPVHSEMADLIRFGEDFRNSPSYKRLLRLLNRGRPVKRNMVALSSPELIDRYFMTYLNLLNSVRSHGLLPRAAAPGETTWKSAARRRSERDIGIAIGADGELLRFRHGQHRTALAQLLGLPAIPVELRMVHTDWLKRQVARTKLPPAEALLAGLAEYDLQHRPDWRPELEQNQQPLQV